jgi:uncharacterized membrane protein YqiK
MERPMTNLFSPESIFLPIWAYALLGLLLVTAVLWAGNAFVYIPNDRLGVLEKLWSVRGSVKTGLSALKGEAGFQADVLRGGFHFFVPFQFRVHRETLVTIP